MPKLLVIDDDRAVLHLITQAFAATPIVVRTAQTAERGLSCFKKNLTPFSWTWVCPNARAWTCASDWSIDANVPIVFITGRGSSDTAIEATKLGAYDYLLKPLHLAKLRELVERAFEIRTLMQAPLKDSAGEDGEDGEDEIIGRSPQMQEVFKSIGRVAPQDVTVIIHGESGTGKELVSARDLPTQPAGR